MTDESEVVCPRCGKRLPMNLPPHSEVEIRKEEIRPIQPGEVFVVCKRCGPRKRLIMKVVALAA